MCTDKSKERVIKCSFRKQEEKRTLKFKKKMVML